MDDNSIINRGDHEKTPEPWTWSQPRSMFTAVLFVFYGMVLLYALMGNLPPDARLAIVGGAIGWLTARIEVVLRDRIRGEDNE